MKESMRNALVGKGTARTTSNQNSPAQAPATEQKVLSALRELEIMGKPTHGPAIARASNGAVTVNAVYTLLDRLAARGLVGREEVDVDLGDISVKRVHYRTLSPS